MRSTWNRFLAPLTPGVRTLLVVLTIGYVVALGGLISHSYDLYTPWALNGAAFWKGRVWQIATYALLPAGLLDFLFNWLVLLFVGVWLEKVWSRRQLWAYCLASAVGAGLAWVIIEPSGQRSLVGTSSIVFGLLAAWGYLFPYEKVLLYFLWEMSVRKAAVFLTVLSALLMMPCCGPKCVLVMLFGSLTTLALLWAQSKVQGARDGRTVASERMGRLEL